MLTIKLSIRGLVITGTRRTHVIGIIHPFELCLKGWLFEVRHTRLLTLSTHAGGIAVEQRLWLGCVTPDNPSCVL
jgi:hypothetical protein